MKRWYLSSSVQMRFLLSISGCLSAIVIQPVWAEIKPTSEKQEIQSQGNFKTLLTRKIRPLSEVERPSTSAIMLVQSLAPQTVPLSEIVQVTGVQANPTEKGVEVILQTTQGEQLQITNNSAENNFIADIPNAQLRLPNGDGFTFRSQNPIEGITEITVINLDANTIRVSVAGETGLPTIELFDDNAGLVFAFTSATTAMQPEPEQPTSETPQEESSAQQDEPIELVVTAEQQDGYRVPNASTATRTDTPLRDIPQSIQIVPQEILRDQNITRLEDALRNVSGVTQAFSAPGTLSSFTIRGFAVNEGSGSNFLRDGLPDPVAGGVVELPNIERIEVLRGPASVLYGFGNPGGTINLVTKQPLADPFYEAQATIGNYSFYQGAIDFSGALNDSKTVLYRLNAAYRNSGSFIDFFDSEYLSFSPVLRLNIGEQTNLSLEGEYIRTDASFYSGIPVTGSVLSNPNGQVRRNRNFGEPTDRIEQTISRIGYRLEHNFSENWSLRNAFRATFRDYSDNITLPTSLGADNQTLNRIYREIELKNENYSLITDVTGRFSTGLINHQVVFGVDLNRFDFRTQRFRNFNAAPIDIFNPIYGQLLGDVRITDNRDIQVTDSLGIFIQDQITLADNFKLLLGGRFDTFSQRYESLIDESESSQSESAFSPRLGIVYQPIPTISLYASYARSFTPANGINFLDTNQQFQPQRGTQYEIGAKADLGDRLSATVALYDLTQTNVLTADPNNPEFSIQTGEQKSQGVELNLAGEIIPGWNVFAGYTYTNARITNDNTFAVGNRLNNTPENSFNLWTTYEIQAGSLKGLGFGLGLFFVGERQGNLANTFQLPSYLRTDAAIFYNQDRFRAALNFKNLFDVDYFPYGLNLTRVYYGQPFTVQGTISWQF
ncbi:MAG: TonB-dependent siderophore receptor [Nostoc sp. LLA-1]|nr:TonB-dependent siderophore receptor [Cyanocohniella sp. LLY]